VRLTLALISFAASADRTSRQLNWFTIVLVLLTLALVLDAVLRHFE